MDTNVPNMLNSKFKIRIMGASGVPPIIACMRFGKNRNIIKLVIYYLLIFLIILSSH